jgi:dihydropteroate synthase
VYRLIEEGADIIDLGAESTRPGAQNCSIDHEIERLIPVMEAIKDIDRPISVDTNKTEVMKAVINAGAAIINDIRALQDKCAIELLAQSNVAVCLMHMQNDPENMQDNPSYDNIAETVLSFLAERIKACETAGIDKNRIIIDPGFGFGKTCTHNITLFKALRKFCETGYPVLAGVSRKRFLGEITGREVSDRTCISAAAAMLAVEQGVHIIRVHDVKETKDMLTLLEILT